MNYIMLVSVIVLTLICLRLIWKLSEANRMLRSAWKDSDVRDQEAFEKKRVERLLALMLVAAGMVLVVKRLPNFRPPA